MSRIESAVWMISLFTYKLGAFLARHLPTRLSESITAWLAEMQCHTMRTPRKVVMSNLRVILGDNLSDGELSVKSKIVFSNFARSIYYFLRMPYIDKTELVKRCDYNGLDQVIKKVHEAGGFVMVGPHVGTWELGGACLSALGVRIHTIAWDHGSAGVTRFFEERRRSIGVHSIPIGRSLQALRHALNKGDSVALLADRAYGNRNMEYEWFNTKVELPTGHAALAVHCNAPILTVICVFRENGGIGFEFGGPYYPDESLSTDEAVDKLQRSCLADMERFILKYHEQWFHFRKIGEPVK